jgi:dolichol-phosphate mannosyltransferase
MKMNHLWVVMPVYNEEEAIERVVQEWVPALESSGIAYTLCILNDGSKDQTLEKLTELQKLFDKIQIIDKVNSGHGQSCVLGYQLGIEAGADWIFQIDSDGQCDPRFFPAFIDKAKSGKKAIYGKRVKRDDGLQRMIVSRFVTLFTLVATGTWIVDGNVPYRLMHKDILTGIENKVPKDFHLANILVSVITQRKETITWVPIHFRDRIGGVASVKTFSFIKNGFKLFKQLKRAI